MTDFTQLSRTDWIALFERFNNTLFDTVSAFDERQWNRRSPYIGWRVRDVLKPASSSHIKNPGNRHCFWHFFQRTTMTEERIRQKQKAT